VSRPALLVINYAWEETCVDSPSVDEPSRRRGTYMNLSELNIVKIFSCRGNESILKVMINDRLNTRILNVT